MPWKASSVMEERLRFVARVLDGEAMTEVCREFGISRKTGYKIFDRYKEHGLTALSDRSRRPVRNANQLPQQVESLIVRLKADKPHWGARKIRELLVRRLDGDIRVPAKSTIHAVLPSSDYLFRNDWLSSLIGALLCRLGCGRGAPGDRALPGGLLGGAEVVRRTASHEPQRIP